jgi:hypothetical protein
MSAPVAEISHSKPRSSISKNHFLSEGLGLLISAPSTLFYEFKDRLNACTRGVCKSKFLLLGRVSVDDKVIRV